MGNANEEARPDLGTGPYPRDYGISVPYRVLEIIGVWIGMSGLCSVPKCASPARSRGMCAKHYSIWYREKKAKEVGTIVTQRGSAEWKAKISAANKGKPRTQWLDDYFHFMKADERRKEYRRRGKATRKVYKKQCEWCDADYYTPMPSYARFCTPKCRVTAYWYDTMVPGVCEMCGTDCYFGRTNKARFCGPSCAGKAGALKAWERHGKGKRLGV